MDTVEGDDAGAQGGREQSSAGRSSARRPSTSTASRLQRRTTKGRPGRKPLDDPENERRRAAAERQYEQFRKSRRRLRFLDEEHYVGTKRTAQGHWEAQIRSAVAGTGYCWLGSYETELDASIAYDLAIVLAHGPHGMTNHAGTCYRKLMKRRHAATLWAGLTADDPARRAEAREALPMFIRAVMLKMAEAERERIERYTKLDADAE